MFSYLRYGTSAIRVAIHAIYACMIREHNLHINEVRTGTKNVNEIYDYIIYLYLYIWFSFEEVEIPTWPEISIVSSNLCLKALGSNAARTARND